MKRIFLSLGLFIALGVNLSWSQETLDEVVSTPEIIEQYTYSEETPCVLAPLDINGYLNAGYFGNTNGSVYNGNANTGAESGGALNGTYLSIGKSVENNCCGFDFGFKTDIAFGEDTRFMRVNSGLDEDWYTGHDRRRNDTYGFALPQAYIDVAMNQWLVRVGHFYTPLGYESGRADKRFFYTRSLSFDGLPVVQSGIIAYYKGFQNLEIGLGWTNGLNEGFDHEDGGSLFTMSAKYHFNEQTYFKYATVVGDIFDTPMTSGNFHMYGQLHSFVLESQLNRCLTAATTVDYQLYGISGKNEDSQRIIVGQHFYRQINNKWKLGMRLEWQKDEEEIKNDSEFVSMTFGGNWDPRASEHLVLRPELRYDKSTQSIYNNGQDDNQLALAIDLLFRF
ncbi:MAG: outer membrane beta-barrel protein [Planctomycetia bacterium]|nr:outer membrane beta-barrel protein [Planctomycetia bacterium]